MIASSSLGTPRAFTLVAFVTMTALGTVACGPPPPLSPQEILRDTTPAIPLTTAQVAAGAEASFGSTTVLVESVEPTDGSRDLAKSSVMDSLALVASAADSVDSAASDIRAAAEVAKNGAQATAQVGPVTASVRVKSTVRVRDQAEAVRKGASDVEKGASANAVSVSLAILSLVRWPEITREAETKEGGRARAITVRGRSPESPALERFEGERLGKRDASNAVSDSSSVGLFDLRLRSRERRASNDLRDRLAHHHAA